MADEIVTAPNFCILCGAPAMAEWTGYYRANDGEKEMRAVCSANPCEHNMHAYKKIRTIAPRLWGWSHNGGAEYQCVRCGHKRTDLDYST